jgi:hypothetical protein
MKTGTTALGVYFSDATAAGILPKNVVYPTGNLWFPVSGRITKHGQLFDYLVDRSDNTVQNRKVQDAATVEAKVKAAAEFASSLSVKDPTVVYIHETLARSPKTEQLVTMLRKYFSSVTFVLAIRSPVASASSRLVHRIKDWALPQFDFDLMAMLVDAEGRVRFNDADLVTRWTGNKQVTTELIPIFENETDGYASVDRFLTIVTGKPAPRLDDDFGSRRIHPSLPLKSLKRLIALKNVKRRFGAIPFVAAFAHKLFERVLVTDRQRVVQAGFGARSAERGDWVISADERARITALFTNLGVVLRSALGEKATSADWRAWFAAEGL